MRRKSRECALQILYQLDIARELGRAPENRQVDAALAGYWASFSDAEGGPVDRQFTERLVRGITEDVGALDAAIAAVSQHWRLNRMSTVDRNLLRVAAYEILRCPDIPRAVSINEALEIAKRFGGDESRQFVNGVLDHLARPTGEAQHGR